MGSAGTRERIIERNRYTKNSTRNRDALGNTIKLKGDLIITERETIMKTSTGHRHLQPKQWVYISVSSWYNVRAKKESQNG